jgi:acyl carrier protein
MSTSETSNITKTLFDLFWQALAGGDYDLDLLKRELRADSKFQQFLIDSLDLTDFLLRVKDQYNIQVPFENVPRLDSLEAIEGYIHQYQRTQAATAVGAPLPQ